MTQADHHQKLRADFASATSAGNKEQNADACDARIPVGSELTHKGIAAAIADGMSSSAGGQQASHICITNFLSDYYATPDSWTVKSSAIKVLGALNHWLYSQGQIVYDEPRALVTTFSALIIKSNTIHVVHVGDSRIYRFRENKLKQLTRDHRVWVGKDREFLSRAMGADQHVDIDYSLGDAQCGDIFLMMTDGISGHVTDNQLGHILSNNSTSLQAMTDTILELALKNGSEDNVCCQAVKILELPPNNQDEVYRKLSEMPFPPELNPGNTIDSYHLERILHESKRSTVFLAKDIHNDQQVCLKTPSINYQDDSEFIDQFLHEEWVSQRITSAHVIHHIKPEQRNYLYNVSEYIEGQSLRQWMLDHPQPHINQLRAIISQIASGLRAMHRQEMIHLDLKPENIMLDINLNVKIIDLGSSYIAGASELNNTASQHLGTLNYSAPECADGQFTPRADLFSLGVICYEMLSSQLPYGDHENRQGSLLNPGKDLQINAEQYQSIRQSNPEIRYWIDRALQKACHPDPTRRYSTISEFIHDLNTPNPAFEPAINQPLIEKNPVAFWKGLSLILFLINLYFYFR